MFESRVKWPSSLKKNLVSYFCKILLKIILIRIIYRSAMATTSVPIFLIFAPIQSFRVHARTENIFYN